MAKCGECCQYPWFAHTLMVYDKHGAAVRPVVRCKLQPRMLVWHTYEQPRLCIDFGPRKDGKDERTGA